MQESRVAELAGLTARIVAAVAGEEPIDAAAATLLLRRYLETDDAGLREALGPALAYALAAAFDDDTMLGRAAWLTVLVEATAVSDDERLRPAVEQLVAAARTRWPGHSRIDDLSASVEACLRAAEIVDPSELVQDAIDQLERVIGGSYQPGAGLMGNRDGVRVRCGIADHVRGASALLTAFELTGRLPYSMLAEELIVAAGRDRSPDGGLAIQCEAARVLCRLARLHDDPEYRGAAVIATGADYRAEASRILAAQSVAAHAGTASVAAAYGLALDELLRHVR